MLNFLYSATAINPKRQWRHETFIVRGKTKIDWGKYRHKVKSSRSQRNVKMVIKGILFVHYRCCRQKKYKTVTIINKLTFIWTKTSVFDKYKTLIRLRLWVSWFRLRGIKVFCHCCWSDLTAWTRGWAVLIPNYSAPPWLEAVCYSTKY